MSLARVPLEDRLHSVDVIGCDPSVLPDMVNAWGNSPAKSFFLEKGDWERMKELLSLNPEREGGLTYRQMAWGIYVLLDAARSEEETQLAQEALFLLNSCIVSMDRYLRSRR